MTKRGAVRRGVSVARGEAVDSAGWRVKAAFVRFGLRWWENGDWFDAHSAFLFP